MASSSKASATPSKSKFKLKSIRGGMTLEEQQLLDNIKKRKELLKAEIGKLQEEMDSLETETKSLDGVSVSENDSNSGAEAISEEEKRIMILGCKKFNLDSKKGIEFLISKGVLKKEEQEIAQFLFRGTALNKTAIGDYLGEKNDFNEGVLKAFVELHDFTNIILVQALRDFLWSFRLPGEAQKIDRMMEAFAKHYCQTNPGIFTNTDTCYVLSFSIIMLNTSLHNPAVKDKPNVERFISMNRGIDNGGDLPKGLLVSLFNSIKTEPFKIPEDDGNDLMHTFFNSQKEGWLLKQGGLGRFITWNRRWFMLSDKSLYYFEYTSDKEPKGIIPLENVEVRVTSGSEKSYDFEICSTHSEYVKACKKDSNGRVVQVKHSAYRLSALCEEERDSWVKNISAAIYHTSFEKIPFRKEVPKLGKKADEQSCGNDTGSPTQVDLNQSPNLKI